MDEPLYDEFGNYIGPELRSSDDEDSDAESERSERDEASDAASDDEVGDLAFVWATIASLSLTGLFVGG